MEQRELPLTVNPRDILPVIKRSLFAEREVFLRELIANAVDAIDKIDRVVRYKPEFQGESTDLRVVIEIDPRRHTITISDNGVGMTEDEVLKYINQIAVSGARDFMEQCQSGMQLNGRFGLGFYSSFMVSKLVELNTWSWQPGGGGCDWSCDGGPMTRIGPTLRRSRGTSVVCHLDTSSVEFLKPDRIESIVRRYLDFARFPILLDGRQLNMVTAPWHFNRDERERLGRGKYEEVFRRFNPGEEPPLGWFHAEVEVPIEARALFFIPRARGRRGCTRVFAARTYVCEHKQEDLLPPWLAFLDGILDTTSMFLTAGRDQVQEARNLAALRNFVTKKAVDYLADALLNRRAEYSEIWDIHGGALKEGFLMSAGDKDDRLAERLEALLLFPSSHRPLTTLGEYRDRAKREHVGRFMYLTDERSQAVHLELCRARGAEVLWLTDPLDPFVIEVLRHRHPEWRFLRVDEVEGEEPHRHRADWDDIIARFRGAAGGLVSEVRIENLPHKGVPAILRIDRDGIVGQIFERAPGMSPGGGRRILVVNNNSGLVTDLLSLLKRPDTQRLATMIVADLTDTLLNNAGLLTDDSRREAVRRHLELLSLVTAAHDAPHDTDI